MRTLFCTLLSALLLTITPAHAAPLPADKPGFTERDLDDQRLKWIDAYVVAPFKAFAAHTPTEEEIAFVRDSVTWSDRPFALGDRTELLKQANRIAATDPTDPWLLHAISREFMLDKRPGPAGKLAFKALENIKTSKYPAWFHYLVASTAIDHTRDIKRREGDPDIVNYAMDKYLEWVASDFAPRTDDTYFYLQMRRPLEAMFGESHTDRFIEKLRPVTTGNLWMRDMLLGKWEVNAAWKARGKEFADKVKPEAWPVFYEHLEKSQEHFTAAHKRHPECPYAAYEMLTVAKGLGDQSAHDQRYWFDQAVAAQFDYHAAYHAYFANLQPRWGGSHEQMLDFARECYETKRFDTRVPYTLVFMLETLRLDFEGKLDFLTDEPELYELTEYILDRYTVEYQKELTTVTNPIRKALVEYRLRSFPTQRAVLAWWTQDWADGYKALASINFELELDAARRLGADYELTHDELAFYGGPAGADAIAGRKALARGDKPAAQKSFGKAAEILESLKTTMPEAERNLALRALEREMSKTIQ